MHLRVPGRDYNGLPAVAVALHGLQVLPASNGVTVCLARSQTTQVLSFLESNLTSTSQCFANTTPKP
jgi:hypothetical protein